MSKILSAALSAALALAACSAGAHQPAQTAAPIEAAQHQRETPSLHCDVVARRTANGVLIEANVRADRDIDGEYSLTITKSDRAGSADTAQSGPLLVSAGDSVALGQTELSIERGARVRALLTLHDSSGEICRSTFRL